MAVVTASMTALNDETDAIPIVGQFNVSVDLSAGEVTLYRSRVESPFVWKAVEVFAASIEKIGESVGSDIGPFYWKAVASGNPTTATVEISDLRFED
jgi:hypothetical protein